LGASFGLSLYGQTERREPADKHQPEKKDMPSREKHPWVTHGAAGEILGIFVDPVLSCSSLRRALESAATSTELQAIFAANRRTLARLSAERPDLRSDADQHYSEIIAALFQARLKRFSRLKNRQTDERNGRQYTDGGSPRPMPLLSAYDRAAE
jgi:hypothetical protein